MFLICFPFTKLSITFFPKYFPIISTWRKLILLPRLNDINTTPWRSGEVVCCRWCYAGRVPVTITLLCENNSATLNWGDFRWLRAALSDDYHMITRGPDCSTRCSRTRPRSPGYTGPACTCWSSSGWPWPSPWSWSLPAQGRSAGGTGGRCSRGGRRLGLKWREDQQCDSLGRSSASSSGWWNIR